MPKPTAPRRYHTRSQAQTTESAPPGSSSSSSDEAPKEVPQGASQKPETYHDGSDSSDESEDTKPKRGRRAPTKRSVEKSTDKSHSKGKGKTKEKLKTQAKPKTQARPKTPPETKLETKRKSPRAKKPESEQVMSVAQEPMIITLSEDANTMIEEIAAKLFPMLSLDSIKDMTFSAMKDVQLIPMKSDDDDDEEIDWSSQANNEDDESQGSVILHESEYEISEDEKMDFNTDALKVYLDQTLTKECKPKQRKVLKVQLEQFFKDLNEYKTVTLKDILESDISLENKYEALKLYRSWKRDFSDSIEISMKMDQALRTYIGDTDPDIRAEVKRLRKDHVKETYIQKILKLETTDKVKAALIHFHDQKTSGDMKKLWHDKMIWYTSLPYQKVKLTKVPPDQLAAYCSRVYDVLDSELYGMTQAKQEIVTHIYNKMCNPNYQVVLGLWGKPGTGKTAFAQAVAKALGLPYQPIAMAGITDPSLFKGHEGVYTGSGPSVLIQKLRTMDTSDGVLLLDELDKLPLNDVRSSQVQYAMLHLLDPLQNHEYQDLYLNDITHDFSRLWIIVTVNDVEKLDSAVRDRIHFVHIPDYTPEETDKIMQQYTLPKLLAKYQLDANACELTHEACVAIRNVLPPGENGTRFYARMIEGLIKKIALIHVFQSVEGAASPFQLDDFVGFPYTITAQTVNQLMTKKSQATPKWMDMYS